LSIVIAGKKVVVVAEAIVKCVVVVVDLIVAASIVASTVDSAVTSVIVIVIVIVIDHIAILIQTQGFTDAVETLRPSLDTVL